MPASAGASVAGTIASPATTSTRPRHGPPLEPPGVAHQTAHGEAGFEQARHQASADVAGGTGDQNRQCGSRHVRATLEAGRTG